MAGVIFDDDGITTGGALALLAASIAGWYGAPYAPRYAQALRVGALAGGAWALLALASRFQKSGGLAGFVARSAGGGDQPTTIVTDEGDNLPAPIKVNPTGEPASEFLNLTGTILSPLNGETLHARKQLTLDGTYPVEVALRNDRSSSARGYVRITTVEDTLLGSPTSGGVAGDTMTLPPHSYRRLTINVPAASGRASLGISVELWATFVQVADQRERDLGRLSFLVM